MWEFAFEQNMALLNSKVYYVSDYNLYQAVFGDVLPKYSTYKDDFYQHAMFLHEYVLFQLIQLYVLFQLIRLTLFSMGFYQHYGYEYVPIPFTRQYRNSLGNYEQPQLEPLNIMTYVLPTAFLMFGYLLSFVIFIWEASRTLQGASANIYIETIPLSSITNTRF